MPARKFTDGDLVDAWAEGLDAWQMAARFGCHRMAVYERARRLGLDWSERQTAERIERDRRREAAKAGAAKPAFPRIGADGAYEAAGLLAWLDANHRRPVRALAAELRVAQDRVAYFLGDGRARLEARARPATRVEPAPVAEVAPVAMVAPAPAAPVAMLVPAVPADPEAALAQRWAELARRERAAQRAHWGR